MMQENLPSKDLILHDIFTVKVQTIVFYSLTMGHLEMQTTLKHTMIAPIFAKLKKITTISCFLNQKFN